MMEEDRAWITKEETESIRTEERGRANFPISQD